MSAAEVLVAKLDELIAEVRALRKQSGLKVYTRQEAAEVLNCDRNLLGTLCRAGLVRVINDGGSKGKIPGEEVERLARDGLPSLPTRKRGRPRKQSRSVVDDILAIRIGGK